ncbi:MAG: flagellar protein FlaG [Selenomonadaceae bacterium]|nr:flagellar protein FlaG [Selenomonadaceae bacterium]
MAGSVQDAMYTAVIGGGVGGVQTESQPVKPQATQKAEIPAQQQEDQQQHQYVAPGSMDEKATKNMTEELNKAMERANSNLEFKYHKEVNMMSVAVVDKDSGKVIKELPPEEMVNNMIKSKIWIGAFLDKIA